MKIEIDRQKFLQAFQIAGAVTSPRSPKEILTNVKIEASDNTLTLMATDMEAGIRIDVDNSEIKTPGKALLPVVRVMNIFREISDERVHMSASDETIDITSSQSKFHLPSSNPDAFPTIAGFAEEAYFAVRGASFAQLVQRTVFATETESTRYALGGVLMEIGDDTITAVATDGRRLATMSTKGTAVAGYKPPTTNTIVPIKTLNLLEKSISDPEDPVQIVARQNDILIRTKKCLIYSRLVEGRYPNWRQVIPNRTTSYRVSSVVGPFYSCVRQASIVADSESRGVEFIFQNGNVLMQTATANVGESDVQMPISYDGPEIKMTLNGQYLGDFFRVLSPETTFFIDISSNTESALFTLDDGYTNVIMPMARDR